MVDAPDSKSGSERSGGSIPPLGTKTKSKIPVQKTGIFHLYCLTQNSKSVSVCTSVNGAHFTGGHSAAEFASDEAYIPSTRDDAR